MATGASAAESRWLSTAKGATPVTAHLVPSYEPCEGPDRTHGPPLAFPACSSPVATSAYLTVGTADSNGRPTKFDGYVQFDAVVGNPVTFEDEADVRIRTGVVDVRCRVNFFRCEGGALSDYMGYLEGAMSLRITDRLSGPFQEDAATTDVFALDWPVPCVPTEDATVGSTCSIDTTFDALVPGLVREQKRTIWELGQLEMRDGGADGETDTDDYTVFARQGLFVP